jgi:hypothetical protein
MERSQIELSKFDSVALADMVFIDGFLAEVHKSR